MTTVAALTSAPASSGADTKPLPADVEASIRQRIDNGEIVGVVIALIDAEGTSYHAFGVADKGGGKPVDGKTVFEIGSITKAFTGILFQQFVNEGKIAPDDPIDKYLPAGTKTPRYDDKPVTLKTLVTHTSSLPRLPGNMPRGNPRDPYADYTSELMYQFLGECKLEREIGSKYEYSNFGMGLLGQLLSRVAGKSYEELVIERICRPLGMSDTRIELTDAQKARFAKGYDDGEEASPWALNCLAGAGGLRSTAEDMATFIRASMGLEKTELQTVIAQSYSQDQPADGDLRIAHGWHIWTRFGTKLIWHNGGTGGFRSWAGFRPDRNCGVVVLSNSTHSVDDIARHLLEPKWELEKGRKTVKLAPRVLEKYVGYYELAPGAILHITRKGDQLYAQLTGQSSYAIFAEAEDKFFHRVVDAQLTFKKNDKGEVNGLVLHQGGDHPAKRLPPEYKPPVPKAHKEVEIDPKILESYAGRYELAPGAVFDIRARDGKLFARLTGQDEYQVFPESPTDFFYKVVDAQIRFIKDADGKVTALILDQNGMSRKAVRR